MGETINISKIANKVSDDIFKWLRWGVCLPKDENWGCVTEEHEKSKHPSDVVFYYKDPYSGKTIYVNTDLKSYAKGSIKNDKIFSFLQSLSIAVECAEISSEWKELYVNNDFDYGMVVGLLFLWNHDNEYDRSIEDISSTVSFGKLKMSEGVKLYFFHPQAIRRIYDIVSDMKLLCADDKLPKKGYTFFYPDRVMSKVHGDEWTQPASLEALTGPWIIIKHKEDEEVEEGYLIYYTKQGDTIEEFVYLIDALSQYQMLLHNCKIRIRFTKASGNAINNFEKAKISYLSSWGFDEAKEVQLNRITCAKLAKYSTSYNPRDVGMEGYE